MGKQEIIALIDEKLHEVFAVIQKQEGITEGDIDPMDVVALDEATAQIAGIIEKVIKYQK